MERWIRPRPNRRHPHTRTDKTELNWIYLDWTTLLCLEPKGAGVDLSQRGKNKLQILVFFFQTGWLFCFSKRNRSVVCRMEGWPGGLLGGGRRGLNCCMFASDWSLLFWWALVHPRDEWGCFHTAGSVSDRLLKVYLTEESYLLPQGCSTIAPTLTMLVRKPARMDSAEPSV